MSCLVSVSGGLIDGMADAHCLASNRFRNQVDTWLERQGHMAVILEIELNESSIHCSRVCFETAVWQDVHDIGTALVDVMSDEKGPVAVKGIPFGAHQRNAVVLHSSLDSLQATTKTRRICQAVVTDVAVLVTGRVVEPFAQFATEKHVADIAGLQRHREVLAIVLGVESAVRRRTHVCNGSHMVPGQELRKNSSGWLE